MTTDCCKVCGRSLFPTPLLEYPNMPGVAQHLPEPGSVHDDAGVDLLIFQCSGCGLVQLQTEPVHYFREVIRAVAVSEEMRKFRVGQFQSFVDQHKLGGKKVVEIGCGRGEYLSLLQDAGVEACGLEWNQDAVSACVDRGLNVAHGFVDSADYNVPGGKFDAFVLISFFEHLPEPNKALQGIANNLAAGGVGLVEVPNFDMMLRDRMFSEFMRDHLFYFTRRSLTTALELNGFEVLEIREIWHDYILSATIRKREPLDLSAFTAHQQKLTAEINAFIDAHPKVAVWGAGHQSFAVLALLQAGGKIRYVVDSAAFKQGKLTPVTHIPIVAPSTLESDPVDALLIMAGSYGDEIVRIVKEKFELGIKIAMLRDFGVEEV